MTYGLNVDRKDAARRAARLLRKTSRDVLLRPHSESVRRCGWGDATDEWTDFERVRVQVMIFEHVYPHIAQTYWPRVASCVGPSEVRTHIGVVLLRRQGHHLEGARGATRRGMDEDQGTHASRRIRCVGYDLSLVHVLNCEHSQLRVVGPPRAGRNSSLRVF